MATRKRSTTKRAARKKAPDARPRAPARAKPSLEARAKAQQLASRMPFVHFPANTRFADWKTWGSFQSRVHRGLAPVSPDEFDGLRAAHVFAYAGPCCFAAPDHLGDAAVYLDPEVDRRWPGEASPFDSGALEGNDARLQSWAAEPMSVRWRFFQQHVHVFEQWRAQFEQWLVHCYSSPERYLECGEDRYAAGEPDRTRPALLLQHNGTRGRDRYGARGCADRRAWTWEVRFTQPVPFEEIRLLHVPADRLQRTIEAVEQRFGDRAPAVLSLPSTVAASSEALYLHSREALEEFIGS